MGIEVIECRSTPVPESGCWLWDKCVDNKGYGLFHFGGRTRRAHRVSYELYKEDIPKGKHVLHKCDTPSCVNPDHLYIGTNDDNVQDKVRKGRSLIGIKNPSAKLTEDDVRAIRKDHRPQRELAKIYSVDQALIQRIRAGKLWRHVK